ncbi:MAG: hypothetical protein KGQ40_15815, partial [Rhodospirillales bacterium]|nr:hypothetical protein [Rhodospirillales bacterium]
MSASQPPPGADPSMEDILASIRRILSDEGEGEAPVSPAAAPAGGARPHSGPADVAPAGDA